ncbi:MAG: hypothetical protein AAGH90_10635 [Pseudomonadota bacterium]
MKRQIQRLTPFPFDSDFQFVSPPEDETGTILMTAEELAALLADTRDSTATLVRDDTLKAHAEHAEKITDDLKSALERIVDLAAHLDTASLAEEDRKVALESVRRLASTLIDGQADLFDADRG